MNVLFVTRADALNRPGGDTVQLLKTKEALEDLGVKVVVGRADDELLTWADIVHVFNAQTPEISSDALLVARSRGKITFLSPIWWDLTHARFVDRIARCGLESSENIEMVAQIAKYPLKKMAYMKRVKNTIKLADILLPNSEEEMLIIKRDFGILDKPYHIVMNAVDESIFSRRFVSGSGVICCARLEPAKNQLRLVRAAKGIGVKRLTLVGKSGSNRKYTDRVIKEAQEYGYDVLLENFPQDELVKLMRSHKVHALPSFRESPGLSTLEAMSTGLNTVVSDKRFCPLDTYFKSFLNRGTFVINPYSIESISEGLFSALLTEPSADCLPLNMSWKSVGEQTYDAYLKGIK